MKVGRCGVDTHSDREEEEEDEAEKEAAREAYFHEVMEVVGVDVEPNSGREMVVYAAKKPLAVTTSFVTSDEHKDELQNCLEHSVEFVQNERFAQEEDVGDVDLTSEERNVWNLAADGSASQYHEQFSGGEAPVRFTRRHRADGHETRLPNTNISKGDPVLVTEQKERWMKELSEEDVPTPENGFKPEVPKEFFQERGLVTAVTASHIFVRLGDVKLPPAEDDKQFTVSLLPDDRELREQISAHFPLGCPLF